MIATVNVGVALGAGPGVWEIFEFDMFVPDLATNVDDRIKMEAISVVNREYKDRHVAYFWIHYVDWHEEWDDEWGNEDDDEMSVGDKWWEQ